MTLEWYPTITVAQNERGMTFSIFSYCHIAKMSEPMPTLTAMEKKAKHKGRAYSCVRCSRTGKSYTDVKLRTISISTTLRWISSHSIAPSACLGHQRRHLFNSMCIHTTGIDRRPGRWE